MLHIFFIGLKIKSSNAHRHGSVKMFNYLSDIILKIIIFHGINALIQRVFYNGDYLEIFTSVSIAKYSVKSLLLCPRYCSPYINLKY